MGETLPFYFDELSEAWYHLDNNSSQIASMPQFTIEEAARQIVEKLQVEILTLELANAYMKSRRMTIGGSKANLEALNNMIEENEENIKEKTNYRDFLLRSYPLKVESSDAARECQTSGSFIDRIVHFFEARREG